MRDKQIEKRIELLNYFISKSTNNVLDNRHIYILSTILLKQLLALIEKEIGNFLIYDVNFCDEKDTEAVEALRKYAKNLDILPVNIKNTQKELKELSSEDIHDTLVKAVENNIDKFYWIDFSTYIYDNLIINRNFITYRNLSTETPRDLFFKVQEEFKKREFPLTEVTKCEKDDIKKQDLESLKKYLGVPSEDIVKKFAKDCEILSINTKNTDKILVIDANYLLSSFKDYQPYQIKEILQKEYGMKVFLIDSSRQNIQGASNVKPIYTI